VQFFTGSTLIGTGTLASGTASSGSYVTTWSGVVSGSYSVTAKATDNNGAVTVSSAVGVTVSGSSNPQAGLYFINADHLGTPRLIENQSQQAVWKWDQAEPFGDSVPNQNVGSSGAFVFNPRFRGQYYDVETNTNYNYYRTYNPAIGEYIESDPIGLRGGINTYTYVLGNPLSRIDPRGLNVETPIKPPPVKPVRPFGGKPRKCSFNGTIIVWTVVSASFLTEDVWASCGYNCPRGTCPETYDERFLFINGVRQFRIFPWASLCPPVWEFDD